MEARFYLRATIAGSQETLALCSLYSPADEQLNRENYGALNVFSYEGVGKLVVIRVTSILSVVAMVPFGERVEGDLPRFFLAENPAVGVVDTGVIVE